MSAKFAKTNKGVRFGDERDGIRIMMADMKSPHESQRRPYVRIVRNGQVVDKYGNRIPGGSGDSTSEREDVHIPLRDWNYWREWAKP